MKTETLKKIEQAGVAVDDAQRRYDAAMNRKRTQTRPETLENFLVNGDGDDLDDGSEELAAAKQALCRALRSEIQTRRGAVPEFEQADAAEAAKHAAAVQAVDKEIEATKADKKEALRKLGFACLVDAPRPVSFLGSFASVCPTLAEQFLAGNSEILALEARRRSLLASARTPQVPSNAATLRDAERRLTALLAPPKSLRRVVGFPMVFIDRAAPEHEAAGQWPEWELRQASVPVE